MHIYQLFIVKNLLKALLGNGLVNTFQHTGGQQYTVTENIQQLELCSLWNMLQLVAR
jgi:hypothetical protein